ncbi:MAG TPA: hypothetical protein VHF89_14280 [Solirubrobacteraceae bacterium]|nr:hypothetical protein [Solirubrobacteraceae bacterium]
MPRWALLTEAWIAANRARRRLRKPALEEWREGRLRFVDAHAPGRSFADVGGLYSAHGEIAFRAEEAGASSVSLMDAGDPGYDPEYISEHDRRGSRVRFVQGDLHDPATVSALGEHDVVWCTGVVYHTPHPVDQLMKLRSVTRELLYLGTHTIPEVPGLPQACVFYPHLPEAQRRALARPHWRPRHLLGVGAPFDDRPMHGYANFWWGITPSALRAMLRTARFEIVEERRVHAYPWYVEVVARPVARDPSLPPVSYYRRRAEARERGEPELPFDDYYDRRRDSRSATP